MKTAHHKGTFMRTALLAVSSLVLMLAASDADAWEEDFELYEPSLTNLLDERFNQDPLYGAGNSGWDDYYRSPGAGLPTVITEFGHIVAAEGLGCVSNHNGPCYSNIVPVVPSYARPGVGTSQGLSNVEGGSSLHGYSRALDQTGPANKTIIFAAMVNMEGKAGTAVQSFLYLGEDDMQIGGVSDFRARLEITGDGTAALEYNNSAQSEPSPSIFPIDDASGTPVAPVDGWLQFALEVNLGAGGVPISMSARHRAPAAGNGWEKNPHDANQSFEPKLITAGHATGVNLTHAAVQMGVNATFDNLLVTDTSVVLNNPGDVNGDLVVDVLDLNLVLSNWGNSGMELTWGGGDIAPYDTSSKGHLSGDFIVDGDDYADVLSNLGNTYLLLAASSSAVPEPTTSVLLLLGGLTGLLCRRHKKVIVASACLAVAISLLSVPTASAAERGPIGKEWVQQHPFQILGHQEYLAGNPANVAAPIRQDTTQFYGAGLNTGWGVVADDLSIAGVPWHFPVSTADYNVNENGFQVTFNNALTKPNELLRGWHIQDDVGVPSDSNHANAAAWLRETTNGSDSGASGIGTFDLPVWGTLLDFKNGAFGGSATGYSNYVNTWITNVQPDILSYSNYPSLSGSVSSGTLTTHYDNMMLIRNAAVGASYDLPYTTWIASSISRAGGDGSSELRMRAYSALATGHKGISYFRYDGPGSTLFGPNLVSNQAFGPGTPSAQYNEAADLNLEIKELGKSLKFLDSKGVRYVKKGTATAVPAQMPAYTTGAVQSQMTDIQITSSAGSYTDGMIGYFDDDKGDEYFMLTNLNFNANVAATDALDFEVQFDGTVTSLERLDRTTGNVVTVPLTGNKLSVTLPGGTGELYKYNTGSTFAKEQQVTLQLVPVIDPSIPEHHRTFDVMATVDSDVDSFEMILNADRAGSIYQDAAGNTYTEPNPALFGANPNLEADTYVTMAPGTFGYSAPVAAVTTGATTLDSGAVLTFDNKDLNIAWSRTNDTFDSGSGTHRVARITMQNRATATYEVRGEQSGIYANPETIEGAIATDIQPLTIAMEALADQTGVPAGYTTYDILANVDSDLSAFQMILTTGGGPGSLFQHGSGTDTEPDPALFGANPTLPFDTFVAMGAFTYAQGATLVPGVGATDIGGGALKTFDDETLDLLWTLTNGTFQSDPGTFQVGRITLADASSASYTVKGWQADDALNPITIMGTLNGTPGDFNGDGKVDGADFLVWQRTDGTPAGLTAWQTNYGTGALLGAATGAVPEPTSVVLLGLCLSTLACRRRSN